jgi:hypothetical protein
MQDGGFMFKKLLIISLILISASVVFSQSIPSGTGRYEALGFNPFMTDPAYDLNRNPAWGHMFRNYAFGDIGRADLTDANLYKLKNQYAGVSFGLGPKAFGGFVFNKNEGRIFDSVFYVGGPWGMRNLGMDVPIVPIKLFIGFTPNNGKFILSGSFYYAQKSTDSTLPGTFVRDFDTSAPGPIVLKRSSINTNYNVEKKSSIIGFTLGSLMNFNDGWFEGNIDLRFNNMKYTSNADTLGTNLFYRRTLADTSVITSSHKVGLSVENDGALEFNGFLRGMVMVNKANKIHLVPYFNFGFFSWKPKYTPTNSANDTLPIKGFASTNSYQDEYKYFNLNGGVGINMPVFDNGLLGLGLSIGYNSYTYNSNYTHVEYSGNGIQPPAGDTLKTVVTNKVEYKKNSLILPKVNFGLEWKFTDWMTARVGYSRAIINDKSDGTITNTTTISKISAIPSGNYTQSSVTSNNPNMVINDQNPTDPIQTISLGLGFHFNRFSVDGLIGEKFFQKGVNLFSGQDDKEMFGVLSASYNFNLIHPEK